MRDTILSILLRRGGLGITLLQHYVQREHGYDANIAADLGAALKSLQEDRFVDKKATCYQLSYSGRQVAQHNEAFSAVTRRVGV
jgi:hypothetical protein